jgi:MFS family permease
MAARDSISAAGWAVLLATYFAYMTMYCARKPFSVVKTSVQKEQGISSQQLANIDTALLATYAAGQLSLGLIVKMCGGRKKALFLSFLLAGAATAAFGLADTPGPMLGAWALAGLFAAPASPLFSILVGESVPEKVRLCPRSAFARGNRSLRAVLPFSQAVGQWRRARMKSARVVSCAERPFGLGPATKTPARWPSLPPRAGAWHRHRHLELVREPRRRVC